MQAHKVSLDALPMSRFHWRITLIGAGGPLLDGYVLAIIAVALPAMHPEPSATMMGLLGASVLIGMFAGGLVFGPITDRVGRRLMFVLNLVALLVLSLVQLAPLEMWQLVVVRLAMGVVLGADYPIATSMVTEFVPRTHRGPCLVLLIMGIYVGYVLAYAAGLVLPQDGAGAAQWILASSAVPSLVFLLLRAGTPESPRWLISHGRLDEAKHVVTRYLGDNVDFEALVDEERSAARTGSASALSRVPELFKRGYGKVLAFCAVFWICQVAPSFAVKTFQPTLLEQFDVGDAILAGLLITAITALGSLFGMLTINNWGRRNLLIWSFVISVVPLALLGVLPAPAAAVVVTLFIAYNVAEAAGASLQFPYPNELFPTDLRATGVGMATALSRIGAAGGTFVLPLMIDGIGINASVLIAAGVCLVGLLASWLWAPETRHLTLAESSARPLSLGRTPPATSTSPERRNPAARN